MWLPTESACVQRERDSARSRSHSSHGVRSPKKSFAYLAVPVADALTGMGRPRTRAASGVFITIVGLILYYVALTSGALAVLHV